MTNVVKVSENEAVAVLNNIKGSPLMAITQRTYPKLLKKDRDTKVLTIFQQDSISKVSTLTIKVGSEYVTRVLNQLKRESKQPTEYKQGINTNPIHKLVKNGILGESEKNGKLMFEYGTLKNAKPVVSYYHKGNKVNKDYIGNILPTINKATNQGTDVEVKIRKVYFENILDFTFDKVMYQIVR